jgi:hypothetical protein
MPAQCQLKVLFLGWQSNPARVHNVMLDILGSDPRFSLAGSASLDGYIDGLPSLATLQAYDAVLVWTDVVPDFPTLTSNRLADYVDSGGGLLVSTFWGQEMGNIGRLGTPGYLPLNNPDPGSTSAAALGAHNASDPLFKDVSSLSASLYRGDYFPGLAAGATLAGSWDDGKPLAAYNSTHKVVQITLYPDVYQLVHATGDYHELFRNGLAMAGGPAADPPSGDPSPEPGTVGLLAGMSCVGGMALARRKYSR